MKRSKSIAGLLTVLMIFQVNIVFASKNRKISIVVVPVHDFSSDNLSDNVSGLVRKKLKSESGLYIVDKDKVDSVLRYYDRNRDNKKRSQIQRILARARESYYRFNYVEAKSLVRRAISDLTDRSETIYDNGDILLDANLALGIIARSMGDEGEARQAFEKALRLDPNYKLDSRAFPPSMVNLFENARKSIDKRAKAGLKVVTSPKMAEVYLNGILKGVTPLTIENLQDGRHYLKISANRYTTIRKQIGLKSGQNIKIKERLSWKGKKKEKLTGKSYVDSKTDFDQLNDGLKIANLLKADKSILIDVDENLISAKMIDSKYRTGHKPIIISYKESLDKGVEDLTKKIVSNAHINLAKNPEEYVDPAGSGDTVLMGKRERRKISKPAMFGIIGGVLAAGLGAGLAAAFAGGGGSQNGAGSVNVTFK